MCVFEGLFCSCRRIKVSSLALSHRKPVHRSKGLGVAEMYSFTRKYVITSLAEISVSTHLCVSVFFIIYSFLLLRFFLQNLSDLSRKRNTEDQQFHILDFVTYERNKRAYFLHSVMFLSVNVTNLCLSAFLIQKLLEWCDKVT